MQDHPLVSWSAPVLVAGRYQVVRALGTDARSSTFLARDLVDDEWRAIAIAHADLPAEDHAHLLREGRLAQRLPPPHAPRVVEVLTVGTAAAIVSERQGDPPPGAPAPAEEVVIEELRVRLAKLGGLGLDELATEAYTAHDAVEEAPAEVVLEPLRVEPTRRSVAAALPPAVREAGGHHGGPAWPAILSLAVLGAGGLAGLGVVGTRIAERRHEVVEAREDLVRVVVEERALLDQVPFAGTARRAIARIERDPAKALRPAREVAERIVRRRDGLDPDATVGALRVEAALERWERAELACGWTCP